MSLYDEQNPNGNPKKIPCFIAYIRDRETHIPIPDNSIKRRRRGIDKGYEYERKLACDLREDILWVKEWGMPEELEGICDISGWDEGEICDKCMNCGAEVPCNIMNEHVCDN